MDIYVRVKAIGKRKDILAPTPYTIPDGICSLRQVLTAVVQKEVAQYNSKEAFRKYFYLQTGKFVVP